MAVALVWILVALVVAAGVLLLAGSASGGAGDLREFARDLRNGVAARRHPEPEQIEAAAIAEVEPVDTSMDVFFQEAAVDEDAYLNVDDITDTLARAKDRAVRGMHGLTRH